MTANGAKGVNMITMTAEAPPVLLTVKQSAAKHPWITEKGLRQRIFRGHESGFNVCVKRFGFRVLLDEAKVFAWLDSQNVMEPE